MFKKLLALLIVFIILILIPSSFAEDANITDDLVEISDDNVLTDISNEIYVSNQGSDSNDGSFQNPFYSIKKAINISSNDSKIIIDEGIYKENNLNITKPLQIIGNGNVVIDAENTSRIFTINTKVSDNVILSGITFTNGRAYQGGAIYVRNAITTIDNSKFINNTALTEGGAIYWNSDYGRLTNCIVEENYARDGAGVSWGGINSTFTGGNYGEIINTTFINNHITQDEDACIGLSIYSENSKVINSTFKNHDVKYNSSFEVLYINGDYTTVSGCLFENNKMTMAGALGFDGNFANAFNNIFINNTISYNDSFGGAIGIQSENANIFNNTFISNGGENCVGGAIFINTIETFSFNFINVTDNVFYNNKALNGAGIYTTGKSNMLSLLIKNNTFNGDRANDGAGIYLVDIYNPVTVKNNSFKNLIADNGACIYSNHCTLDLSNNLMENSTSINGESIFTNGEFLNPVYLKFNDIDAILGHPTTLTASLTDDMNNSISSTNINFQINGENVAGKKGINNFTTTINSTGTYNIGGSLNSPDVNVQNGTLTVNRGAFLNIDNIVNYGGNVNVKVNLVDDADDAIRNAQIILSLEDNNYLLLTDGNGVAQINLNLVVGNYTVTVKFKDDSYKTEDASATITVLSSINASDIIRAYKSDHDFTVKLVNSDGTPLNNSNVIFNIAGVEYNVKTDLNGVAYLNSNLNVGLYVVNVENPVTGEKVSRNINIVKRLAENKNINMYFGAGTSYSILVYGDDGEIAGSDEIVTVTIGGKSYDVKTNEKGYASLKLSGFKSNTYTITANYKGVKVSNKIVIKPVLTAKNISKKKSKTIKFQAKLVNTKGKVVKGKKITFKINKKTYKVKTNNKGVAILKLKNLKVGKYTITSKYGKSTIKNTIKIKNRF